MNFAERLKELRNYHQCTQRQLATFLGLSANCICEWENKRSEPSLSSVFKIANYFDVSSDYLLGLEDDFGARTPAPGSETYTNEEQKFVEDIRKLSPGLRDILRSTLDAMLGDTEEEKYGKSRK